MASTRLEHTRDIAQGKIPVDGPQRSSKWATVRKEHLKNSPKCAVCEGTKQLNVHHIQPFHLHPDLELEPANLITLCESASYGIICHILIGHLGDYKNVNPNSVEDAKTWNAKLKENHKRPNV
jgi:predicted TIM-barrel fold metal-dependent hydrolase